MTETPWQPDPIERPWATTNTAASKRRDVLTYMAALDDGEFNSLVTEARASSKDTAAAKVQQILQRGDV